MESSEDPNGDDVPELDPRYGDDSDNEGSVTEATSEHLFGLGYDSDGEIPFCDDWSELIQKAETYNNIEVGGDIGIECTDVLDGGGEGNDTSDDIVILSNDEIKKLRVDGLRREE